MIELSNGLRCAAVKTYTLGAPPTPYPDLAGATAGPPPAGRRDDLLAGDALVVLAQTYMQLHKVSYVEAWEMVKREPAHADLLRRYATGGR